jgi:hypothetical protein
MLGHGMNEAMYSLGIWNRAKLVYGILLFLLLYHCGFVEEALQVEAHLVTRCLRVV